MKEYSESLEVRLTIEPKIEEVPDDDGIGYWRPRTSRAKSAKP